ncbi:MAG TPA: hypothetical protein V6D22_04405 [Candidatus Obscuribacterales bacterium]
MASYQHLDQTAAGDDGASRQIDAHQLHEILSRTWGREAGRLPPANDTAATHLTAMRLADNTPAGGAVSDGVAIASASGDKEKVESTDKKDVSPIAGALISEAEKAHEGEFSYAPHQGARYGTKDVPAALRCAAAMSQVMINAHKDIGSPLNYRKFYEVGVDKWKSLYESEHLVSPVHGQPRSGDFILASDPKLSHPHMGLLSNENGVMMVYHNQYGKMVKEPLAQSSDFNRYSHKEYLRPN